MGKASKWLRNFLIGRKDNEGKRKNVSVSFEDHGSSMANPPPSPLRRIWSFGKSASDVRVCKSSRSFNTMTASSIVNQAALDLENQHDNTRVLSMAAYETSLMSRAIKDDAARRIQASFRAYLARRALHALKGLVKLQALVRGHLVRKQTTATLRCMHALMSIQLQARVQRIRMASKPQLTPKSQLSTHGRLPLEMGFKREQKPTPTASQGKQDEKNGAFKSKNGFTNRSKTERIEQGITRCFFDEISASKKKQNYEEFSFTTPNSPRHCPPLKSKPTTPGRSSFSSYEYPWMPKYMANTQSSRAKVRSQSEPKQRPASSFKAKGKRTASSEQTNDNNM